MGIIAGMREFKLRFPANENPPLGTGDGLRYRFFFKESRVLALSTTHHQSRDTLLGYRLLFPVFRSSFFSREIPSAAKRNLGWLT